MWISIILLAIVHFHLFHKGKMVYYKLATSRTKTWRTDVLLYLTFMKENQFAPQLVLITCS